MNIKISSFSKEAATKTKGIILRNKIEKHLQEIDNLTIDFESITRFASPFFNNSFAALAIIHGFEKISKIKTINLSTVGKETLDTSMMNAQMLSKNPSFAEEVNKIIQETPKNTGE